ncbi:unnamed protein product [Mesocestoides corti]|uniref:Choline/ethanolaminephosphotransferase 1 n=1 Tax=Mesocestoides corti TaxID=53468 RepID=A0A158QW84_MESCO|nr:unnamed protein product [Mesocestoides corti]
MWRGHDSLPLRPEQLQTIKEHEYSCRGSSLLESYFQVFWCALVPYVPKRIAPNALTLFGLIINALSVLILLYYSPDLKSEIPIIGMPLKYVPFIAIMSAATLNIFRFFSIISEGGAGKAGTTVANTSVLFPAFPFGVVLTFAIMVAVRSPLNLYTSHLVLFLVTFGFVAVKVILKLVVDHMSKSEMAVADSILIGPVALFFNQYFNCPIPEYFVLWCCCILAVADTLLYSSHVCLQLADYLNIYIFRVDKPPPHPDSPQQLRDSKPGTSAPASSSFGRSTHYPGYHRSKWGPH